MNFCCNSSDPTSRSSTKPPDLFVGSPTLPSESRGDGTASLLVQEMNELSVQERERVYAEIHGVNEDIEETPELVATSLEKFRGELRSMSRHKRRVYDKVLFLKPGLENDNDHLLMFLRAASFNAEDAVRKICRHYECKLDLFGPDKLADEITMDDMSEDDLLEFKTGGIRVLGKDQSKRTVWLCDFRHVLGKSSTTLQRLVWYLGMEALRDEETQKHGIVYVECCIGLNDVSRRVFKDFVIAGSKLANAIPLRERAFHFAYDDSTLRPILSLLQLAIGTKLRLRLRLHFGSELEAQYALMSYGILLDDTFLGDVDAMTAAEHGEQYVVAARKRDEQLKQTIARLETETGLIVVPTLNDSLIGRGKSYQDFQGNIIFGRVVEEHSERYGRCSERLDKKMIVMKIIQTVHAYGGRFLQRVDDGWRVADFETTQYKVAQALRFRVRIAKSGENQHANNQTNLEEWQGFQDIFNTPPPSPANKRMKTEQQSWTY